MAISAVNYMQFFECIHFGGVEARCKIRARSASFGARDSSSESNEDSNDSGIGLKLVVKHTFFEIEEGGLLFEPTKSDASDSDAASTAPSGKDFDSTDFSSEDGFVNSPILRHSYRKWSEETDETEAFGDIGDSMSECSEVDLLSCAEDLEQEDFTKAGPPGQNKLPPGQHMPACPPGNFWLGWEGSSELQWPVECSYAGPPGTFFKVCRSGWDQWAQHETSTKPKLIDEERIGDESDQILQGIKSEDDDSSASGFGNKGSDKWADKDNSDAVTKERTTVMLKNLPQFFTRTRLRSLLDSQGFAAKYDFVYVPTAFRSGQSFGYAFVNFMTTDMAKEAIWNLHAFCAESADAMALEVCYSHPNQGLLANIERYRNSPVMHEDVPDEHRPMLLKNGVPSKFPSPTRRIHAPRVRRPASNATGTEDAACE